MFEGYHVHSGFIVWTKRLYAGRHNDVNPRLKHCFKIPQSNSFVNRGEEKAEAPCTLGYDLTPALSEGPFYSEDDCVRRIPPKVLDRWEYEIRLAVDDRLRCKRIAKANKEFSYEEFKGLAGARPSSLRQVVVQSAELLSEDFGRLRVGVAFAPTQGRKTRTRPLLIVGDSPSLGVLRGQEIAVAAFAIVWIENSPATALLSDNLGHELADGAFV